MGSAVYPTVRATGAPGNGALGKRNEKNLIASFGESPLYLDGGYVSTEDVRLSKDTDGAPAGALLTGDAESVNDGGHWGFSRFNLNYRDAPNIPEVVTGGEGLPAAPYYPNITSPGEGNANNPLAQPEYTGESIKRSSNYGVGLGGGANPADTSKSIAQGTVGEHMSGRSYKGSNGKS
jgi:hypothetical protein